MRFKVKDSNIKRLPPPNDHMLQLATVSYGLLREFIVLQCIKGPHKGKTYIEEFVWTTVDFSKDVFGNCKFIDDDNLANDIAKFVMEKGLLDIGGKFVEMSELNMAQYLLNEPWEIKPTR